ncbi:hypothetical protein CARUB_v10021131mg [Capsella rubella]|uniref:HSF-type DNA-binding domain-containing protein n=1 Tax=Capsella rubella TaxID=81985 RepID=R0GJE4_9BRAS|nr:hypothetical protein CARUB_v10021131mg [Capsella rubella]
MVHNFQRGLPSFYTRVYQIVDDPSLDSIVSWSGSNNGFIIWNVGEFCRKILPTSLEFGINFSKFYSRLSSHGFNRVKGPGKLQFQHEYFVRDRPELLRMMMAQVLTAKRNAKKAKAKARRDRVQVEGLLKHLQI